MAEEKQIKNGMTVYSLDEEKLKREKLEKDLHSKQRIISTNFLLDLNKRIEKVKEKTLFTPVQTAEHYHSLNYKLSTKDLIDPEYKKEEKDLLTLKLVRDFSFPKPQNPESN